jgi:hypothetical protein
VSGEVGREGLGGFKLLGSGDAVGLTTAGTATGVGAMADAADRESSGDKATGVLSGDLGHRMKLIARMVSTIIRARRYQRSRTAAPPFCVAVVAAMERV